MKEGEDYNYEIVKHNFSTLSGSIRVGVVKGRTRAELTVDSFNRKLTAEEKEAGWSHFLQRTTLPVTLKPLKRRPLKPGGGRKRA